jgi:RND family efflux transporter MFP subunit
MKLGRTEDGEELEVGPERDGGGGRRRRIATREGGSMVLKLVMLVILLAVGAWALYANLRPDRPAMDMNMRITSGATPFPVVVSTVERGSITGTVVYTGSVVPFNEEDIYPRVTGRIVEMLVYPGDAVRPGQVLARLDSVELSSRVREAEAALAAARSTRVQMEKELAMTEAEAGYARGVAVRTERLFNTGAVSKQESESDRALAATAEAKLEAARAKLHAAEAMLAQGEAAFRTATIVRNYSDIVSSTAGYVVKRLVAPGVLVQPGTVILKVAQIDKVRLQANVGEKDLGSIRIGSPVQVTTAAAGQPPLTATVTAVFPFVEQGPRTAVIEALVDNAGRRLLPGQYVTMQFATGRRDQALIVPASAVVRMGGKATLWVVKDGRAEPREVVSGLRNAERVEITEGLTGGERLVARGQDGLYAGARVSEVPASSPPTVPTATPKHESPATPDMKDMPDMNMPGMKDSTDAPTKPKEGSHAGH